MSVKIKTKKLIKRLKGYHEIYIEPYAYDRGFNAAIDEIIEVIKEESEKVIAKKQHKKAEKLNNKTANTDKEKVENDNTCTHIGDIAQCDQFICSECGIHLEDWRMLVEVGYDDGYTDEMVNYEYEFKFCPNCGRKIVEE